MTRTVTSTTPPAPLHRRRRIQVAPALFLLPVAVLLLIFTLYPIAQSLLLSFQRNIDGVDTYAGTAQYRRLLGDEVFRTAALNTAIFFVVQVPLTLFLALGVAFLLNSPRFPISLLVIWRSLGFNVLIYLAGLQNVPRELYEAAELDGANPWQTFTRITLPSMKPVLLFTVIMSSFATINLFDEVFVLTGGGPSNGTLTLGMYLYRVAFQNFDYSYGSAIAWVIVLLAVIIAGVQYLAGRRNA